MSDEISAGDLLNAMINYYLESMWTRETASKRAFIAGRRDMMLHAVEETRGLDTDSAMEWLAEELEERYAAMAD